MSGENPPSDEMSPDDASSSYDSEQRYPRIPLNTEVRLEFPDLKEFVQEFSSNISLGGMFIRSVSPQPVGTVFDFSCRLADDFPVVQGKAEVVWVRERDEAPERPAGMGCEFLELAGDSRQLIFQIVDRHIQKGGQPFSLERNRGA